MFAEVPQSVQRKSSLIPCGIDLPAPWQLLNLPAFTGYEASMANAPVTGLMASAPHGVWVGEQLAYYEGLHFIKGDGSLNLTPNTILITEITEKLYNWKFKNELQHLNDDICVYPVEYFCCKNWITGKIEKSSETVAIHHYKGSWLSEEDKRRSKYHLMKKNLIIKLIGKNNLEKAKSLRNKLLNKV